MFKRQCLNYLLCISLAAFASGVNAGDENKAADEEFDAGLRDVVLSNPDSAAEGEAKFNTLCVYCHGKGGSGGKARRLKGRTLETDYIFTTITNGKKRGSLNMPPWNKLPEMVRWQLTAYIYSLQKKEQ